MATLGALVELVAAAEGISRERVEAIARAVREAGLIATHGRGPSAAQMSAADAANLLIAVNAAETARDAPDTVRRFRELRTNDRNRREFGQVLEGMIAAAIEAKFFDFLLDLNLGPKGARHEEQRSASKKSDLRIEFLSSRPMAVIEGRVPANLMPRLLPFYPPHEKSAVRAEADRRTAITHRTILAIAEMIRG